MLLSVRTQRVLLLLSLLFALSAGLALAQHPILDGYVAEGLEQNVGLQQQHLAVAQQQQAVTEAEALYRPTLGIDARFSRAGGGRTINFPVGQLLNPVYDALNEQRVAAGLEPAFPTIQDEEINFLRTQEQETKLRVIQPIYQPSIRPNIRLQGHLMGATEAALATSQHELVASIKTSYFDYLMAERLVEILDATAALVDENVRVNESLARNGKVTQDAIYRARTDQYDVAQQRAEAEKNRDLAASYFNYLLARPFDTPIERIPEADLFPNEPTLLPASARPTASADDLAYAALGQRTELTQLDAAIQAAGEQIALTDAQYLPNVSFVADYGIEGRGYS
ncbi:MAG: TolC family protein, partial [Bacteroidota bacterium]